MRLNRMFGRLVFFSMLVVGIAVPLRAQTVPVVAFQGSNVAAGQIIVRFRATPGVQAQTLAQDPDIVSTELVGQTGAVLLRSNSRDVAALLQAYSTRPDVVYAEPNYAVQAVDIPNDGFFNLEYGLKNTGQLINGSPGTAGADIQAYKAWDITLGSRATVVGVVDTGIDYNHPDLIANIWSAPTAFTVTISGKTITCAAGTHGFNAITRTCTPLDDHFHGTHVSGIIGADGNNGVGVSGVNRIASIMGLKFLNSSGSGFISDAVAAMDFAIQAKAIFGSAANIRVLNNSWGGGGFSQAMLDEIYLADTNDMLFVAAAGNGALNHDTGSFYPASYTAPNVLSVAATDNNDALAGFSDYGATTVHNRQCRNGHRRQRCFRCQLDDGNRVVHDFAGRYSGFPLHNGEHRRDSKHQRTIHGECAAPGSDRDCSEFQQSGSVRQRHVEWNGFFFTDDSGCRQRHHCE